MSATGCAGTSCRRKSRTDTLRPAGRSRRRALARRRPFTRIRTVSAGYICLTPGCDGCYTVAQGARQRRDGRMKVFFATDIHGSEICWGEVLEGGAVHKTDKVGAGGDVTGKMMVPITS